MKMPECSRTSRVPPMDIPYAHTQIYKVKSHTKNQGHTSNGSALRVFTDTLTDGKTAPIL